MKKSKTLFTPKEYNHKLYILMRTDLPSLNAGKAMAQAAHAANEFVARFSYDATIEQWMGMNPHTKSKRYFGTTIVLAADRFELDSAIIEANGYGLFCGEVYDPTYPFIVNSEIATLISKEAQTAPSIDKENGQVVMFRNELTCGYIFIPEDSPHQLKIVGDLPLHP